MTIWRFQKYDPAEVAAKPPYSMLKAWMLLNSNPFIFEPAARKTQPDKNHVENVSYTQTHYDDSGWRKLNLPHVMAATDSTYGLGELSCGSL